MDYLPLYVLFSSEKTEHDFLEKYEQRYNSEASLHFPIEINGNKAFFFFHPAIMEKVNKIYALDKKVNILFLTLPGVAKNQYIKKSIIDEVTKTNEIEGVLSTRKEVNDLIEDIKNNTVKKDRLESIVNKYYYLYENKHIDFNSSWDLRKLYDEMLLEEVVKEDKDDRPDGDIFRKGPVNVSDLSGSVLHKGVYPESKIIQYVDTTLNIFNNSNIDPIIRGAICHYLIGYIHPFYDGNGRLARFMTSYLYSQTLTPVIGYRLSMTIKEKLNSYYRGFKNTEDPRNKGDIGTFVYSFLDILEESLNLTIEYAQKKLNLLKDKEKEINQITSLSNKEKELIFFLSQADMFSEFGISIKTLKDNGVKGTDKTIRSLLNNLIDKGYTYFKKSGHTYYYFINKK